MLHYYENNETYSDFMRKRKEECEREINNIIDIGKNTFGLCVFNGEAHIETGYLLKRADAHKNVVYYNGALNVMSFSPEEIFHEYAHYQVASPERRYLKNYGNVMTSADLTKIVAAERAGNRIFIPEMIEEGRARILGIAHWYNFNGINFNIDDSITYFIKSFDLRGAKKWLIENGFIVNNKPTNKLNMFNTFESFADNF